MILPINSYECKKEKQHGYRIWSKRIKKTNQIIQNAFSHILHLLIIYPERQAF